MDCTIIIPNYKTPELTKLCLRSLRKHTDLGRARIVVVDNDSADASLEYLRSLKWITLVERKTASESGPEMHARALDEALKLVDTPFFAVMHTDTIVGSDKWLDYLLGAFDGAPKLAGVGSWKLEKSSKLKYYGQRLEDLVRRIFLHRRHKPEDLAVYQSGPFAVDFLAWGRSLHRMLVAAGYEMRFLESFELGAYIRHLNHATMILNPSGDGRTSKASSRRKLAGKLDDAAYAAILADDTLDQA